MTGPKVLIVDDEPFNIDYLEQELEGYDCEIATAVNGQEALKKAQTESFDLILLDIMMPVMNGFEVLSRLKTDKATRDIPVIVISASTDLPEVVKGIRLGAEDYLPKPFEPTLLHARISSSLERKRLRDLQQLYLKSLERELEIGREIQSAFLPAQLPQVSGWEIAACFKAAREVAGDFYDAFLLPCESLLFVLGDVCGKGVGAALFMTLFRSLIRITCTTGDFIEQHIMPELLPAARLSHVVSFTNNYISETHGDTSMFATVFLGMLNLQSGALTYINCGNEPTLLYKKDGSITELEPSGPVLGLFPNAKFSVEETQIEDGDLILAYTDGIVDALNEENIPFGSQRLRRLGNLQHVNAAAFLQDLEARLEQFIGSAEPFDDITALTIKRTAR